MTTETHDEKIDAPDEQAAEVEQPAEQPTLEAADAPDDDERGNPNREAAKYRKRAQEAEQQRDAQAEQISALKAAIVTANLGRDNVTVDALTAAGHDVNALVDDSGQLIAEAFTVAVSATREKFGLVERFIIADEGGFPSIRTTVAPWSGAFAPNKV